MPLVDYLENKNLKLITWDTSSVELEINDLILSRLHYCQSEFNNFNQNRKKEILGVLKCLDFVKEYSKIEYLKNGKPAIKNKQISISHSENLVFVGLSDFNLGIDIQVRKEKKIDAVKNKFLNQQEINWLENKSHKIDYLHLIWCIKESLFKLNSKFNKDYQEEFLVSEFNLNSGLADCAIIEGGMVKEFIAHYTIKENYYKVWVIQV